MTRTRGNGQGTLFKRNGRGPWIARWFDHEGKRHERSTRTTDKASAERILMKRVTDVALRSAGVIDPRVEAVSKQSRRPIAEHLDDWRTSLRAKGSSERRVLTALRRAERVLVECGVQSLADMEPARVHAFIQRMRDSGSAPRTINGYLQAIKQFIR